MNNSVASDSSSESSISDDEYRTRLDEYGRPLNRPTFEHIGASSVLNRVKEFLPIFRQAVIVPSEPEIVFTSDDVLLPTRTHDQDETASDDSYGVQVDVGLGVYDVNGAVDEEALEKNGTPIILVDNKMGHHGHGTAPMSLIEVISNEPKDEHSNR